MPKDKDDARNFTISDLRAVEGELQGLSAPKRTFIKGFRTKELRAKYVRENNLAETAAKEGTLLDWNGEAETGVGYAIYVEKPKGWRPKGRRGGHV